MPNIKSQMKRVLISREENASNNAMKTRVKNSVKKLEAAVAAGDLALAEQLFPATVSLIDSATSEGVYHKNTAARKQARLAKLINTIK